MSGRFDRDTPDDDYAEFDNQDDPTRPTGVTIIDGDTPLYPCCEHCEPYPRHVYGDAGEPNWCELAGQKDAHRTPCRGTWLCRL